jgi:hypothetical protein
MLVAAGERAAAVQDGPKAVGFHLLRGHGANVRLHHLRNFLLERELPQEIRNAGFDARILRHRTCRRRPGHRPGTRWQNVIDRGIRRESRRKAAQGN